MILRKKEVLKTEKKDGVKTTEYRITEKELINNLWDSCLYTIFRGGQLLNLSYVINHIKLNYFLDIKLTDSILNELKQLESEGWREIEW